MSYVLHNNGQENMEREKKWKSTWCSFFVCNFWSFTSYLNRKAVQNWPQGQAWNKHSISMAQDVFEQKWSF